jgi:hypothetical protein
MPIARRPLSFAAALVLRFGLASGCSGSGANDDPPDPTTEQLRQIGQRVPAFGGVQWDDDRLVVSVLKEEKVGVAREVLRNIFGPVAATIDLQVRPANGEGSEALQEAAREVLSVEAVNSLYYDKTNGYLYVGLTRADALRPPMEKLTKVGISLDAVILQVQHPFFFL